MPINDPQAVRFCNEQARVIADHYAQLYYRARIVQDVWDAQNMQAVGCPEADRFIHPEFRKGWSV